MMETTTIPVAGAVMKVPVGTQVLADDEERSLLVDLTEVGQRIVLLKGGIYVRQPYGRQDWDKQVAVQAVFQRRWW